MYGNVHCFRPRQSASPNKASSSSSSSSSVPSILVSEPPHQEQQECDFIDLGYFSRLNSGFIGSVYSVANSNKSSSGFGSMEDDLDGDSPKSY